MLLEHVAESSQLQKILWSRLVNRCFPIIPLSQGFLVLEDNVYPSEEGHAALILEENMWESIFLM